MRSRPQMKRKVQKRKKRRRRRMEKETAMMRAMGKEEKKDQLWNEEMEREKRDLVWGLRDCMPDGEESEVENWKVMKRVTKKERKRP